MKFTFPLLFSAFLALSVNASAQLQKISTIAGTGIGGYNGDGMAAPASQLNAPNGVAVDANGNVYVQDFLNYRVRKIATTGYITTIAGNGLPGMTGNGSVGTSAAVDPYGIAVDKHGNVFISDANYGVIRKVNTLGIISTFAGTGFQGYSGDNGPATAAQLNGPYGMAFDTSGNLFVADGKENVVRKISTAGIITTVAGNDTAGWSGDMGPATDARLDSPYAVAVDRKGNLYISDMLNNVIRRVDATGVIDVYAGNGGHLYWGDGAPAVSGSFDRPAGLATDSIGRLYIADADNNVIRMVDTFGYLYTVAGNGTPGFGGDLGTVNGANLHTPFGVAIDKYGSLYIADANNQRIRKTYSTVGVAQVTSNEATLAYPNPFNDQFMVSGLEKSDKVVICDITGRPVSQVWDVQSSEQAFTVSSLDAGVYMLQVSDASGNRKSTIKLVKE